MQTLEKINLADYVPILQAKIDNAVFLKDDWVYPNEYATIRNPGIEASFDYRAQKVVDTENTCIPITRYPNSRQIITVVVNGAVLKFYSSALKKVE